MKCLCVCVCLLFTQKNINYIFYFYLESRNLVIQLYNKYYIGLFFVLFFAIERR